MRSIQTKFIGLILGCVLLCSAVIGGAGILSAKQVIDKNSTQLMNRLCSEKALELDALLSRIEQSVRTLAVYTADQLEGVEQLKTDAAYMEAYTKKLESVVINAADNTEGALAVYVRYNPDFAPPTSGLFWSKSDRNGRFQQLTPTDFSSYNPADIEHVGWYYLPVKAGKAVWMEPYLNQNIDVRMISYVIPIYKDNETIGVVGMDIDFGVIEKLAADTYIYDSGYAFLLNDSGEVMYHKDFALGTLAGNVAQNLSPMINELKNVSSGSNLFTYQLDGQEKRMAFRTIRNGMRLAVTAPATEIDRAKNNLILLIGVAVVVIASISVFMTVLLTRRLIRPLKELNAAAKKIADGDLSISLTQPSRDEVGALAESFQQTVNHLQKYINYINGLAYRDPLTGVKNKTAYLETEQRLEEEMRLGRPEFALVVLDINGLKNINDNYGHDFGDMLIVDACKLICKTFKRSPVYRIGGDEFVAVLEGGDYENYSTLLDELELGMQEHNKSGRADSHLSIARGIAIYNSETDLVFANVFKRADDAMYQNKAVMKQRERENESGSCNES